MVRNGIERREFLTALTAGLLSACGGKPEQAPVQRLPEIPPLTQPTPAETVSTANVEYLTKHARLKQWREELHIRGYPQARVTIIDATPRILRGTVLPAEGLKTRLLPDSFRGPHGPIWTWFLPDTHPDWNTDWNPEFSTIIDVNFLGNGSRVERWAVLTRIKRPQSKKDAPVEFPLFSAIRTTNLNRERRIVEDDELIRVALDAPLRVFVWNHLGGLIPVRQIS